MSDEHNTTQGWGVKSDGGTEMWDARPTFTDRTVTFKQKLMLIFYPKKFFLYRYISKAIRRARKERNLIAEPFRILDVGCGTGAAMVDMKHLFGKEVEVVGLDVVRLQIDIAEKRLKEYGVPAEVHWYDGKQFPFSDHSFDAIYTSDVLGHVDNVPLWLDELHRVLKDGGVLAMFAESKVGKHALLRRLFLKHGLNTDPHAEFHISLYGKTELFQMVSGADFKVEHMLSAVWLKFLIHPEELRPAFKQYKGWKLLPLKWINAGLTWTKKKLHPISTAVCELYSFVEMWLFGDFLDAQGFVILARSKKRK